MRISDCSSDVCPADLDNLTTGTENYNKDVWAGRGTVELGGYGAPVLIRISGDYSKDKSDPRGGHRLITSLATGAPVLDNVFDTRGGLNDPKQDIEAYGLALNVRSGERRVGEECVRTGRFRGWPA